MSIYDFKVKAIGGSETSLNEYRGRVLLVVNVASRCGFTSQYEGLQELYDKYKASGLVVLGFPCNQFGSQEPGSDSEIKSFCETSFRVSFPLFSKVEVNGPDTHPLYQFLKQQKRGFLGTRRIKWNFTKFLVDREGKVVARFSPQTKPSELEQSIRKLLGVQE